MLKSSNRTIGVTLGDPGGIGPEVTAKALRSISFSAKIILIAHPDLFKNARLPKNITFYSPSPKLSTTIQKGKISKLNAAWAWASLSTGAQLIKEEKICSLVTAPLSKEGIVQIRPRFTGHTEYLAQQFKVKHVDMMFTTPKMKTVIVTRHEPIKKLSTLITTQAVEKCITLTHRTLKLVFKINSPKIAVCGLNPHAGEYGLMGKEDQMAIVPAITVARKKRIKVEGPFPADTLFIPKNRVLYDCIIAMYHDQGLIPMKTLYFNQVVNLTMGLPFIRTSPAHGTAYSLAGKNKADPSSMIQAIQLARQLSL